MAPVEGCRVPIAPLYRQCPESVSVRNFSACSSRWKLLASEYLRTIADFLTLLVADNELASSQHVLLFLSGHRTLHSLLRALLAGRDKMKAAG